MTAPVVEDTRLLPWASWWERRCRAYRPVFGQWDIGGRCELRRRHDGDHAIDRGLDNVVRWSTREPWHDRLVRAAARELLARLAADEDDLGRPEVFEAAEHLEALLDATETR